MNVGNHLFIPPIWKFDASGIDDAMAHVSVGSTVYIVGDGDRLAAIKGTVCAIGWAIEVVKFSNSTAGIWR